MNEEKNGECFRKILFHIMDINSAKKMESYLENICGEDPTTIVQISQDSKKIKDYAQKKTKGMKEKKEEKTNESEEIAKKEAVETGLTHTVEAIHDIQLDSPMAPQNLVFVINHLHQTGVIENTTYLLGHFNT